MPSIVQLALPLLGLHALSRVSGISLDNTGWLGSSGYQQQQPLQEVFVDNGGAVADYSFFTHEAYPRSQIRYKRNDGWCDSPEVKSWSGYLDIDDDDTHLFFYYFESRDNPAKDDVLLWINGGPGCSSSLGMLMELGPCRIVEEGLVNGTARSAVNPHSWNTHTNLIFLDQPIGVGFSYAEHGKRASTTEKAAKDVQHFVSMFFETFKELQGRPFHLAGESYGGRYVPLFAASIVDHNSRLLAGGHTPINLRSILIGNGLTDMVSAIPSSYKQACTNTSGAPTGPVLDIHTCAEMQSYVPRCEKWLHQACFETHDPVSCDQAREWCFDKFEGPYFNAYQNPYDVSKPCPTLEVDLCYSASTRIKNLLDGRKLRRILGVHDSITEFIECSPQVAKRFRKHADETPAIGTYYYVTALVERGVDVLIYNGKYDWICSWLSNAAWLDALQWSGRAEYLGKEMQPWDVKRNGANVKAGDFKRATSLAGASLTFATVEKAGHMVPYDQPEVALEMLRRHLQGGVQ